MACVALTFLTATIELEFLQPSPRVCLNDEKAMKTLLEKLSSLQAFLQKESNNGGAPIRDLETKIRDFALKAEDGIEMQLRSILLAKDGEYQHKAHGELHQTLREVAEDAEELLKIINNTSSEPEAASDTHQSIHGLKSASQPVNVVLGRQSSPRSPNLEDQFNEDAFNVVYKKLFHTTATKSIVSIVGIPGVGKTTLAKRVYASEFAENYIRAWVTVPQHYNLQHILLDLLQSMRPTIKNINKGTTLSQLKEQLYKHLGGKEKRYFIVLDNIPNTQAWDDIKTCLPDDPHQIRILLTTQFYNVGRYAAPHRNVHEMCVLDPNRSWDLFCKKLPLKEPRAPEFEEIGKRVVEECEGLPRSIVAVAERLSICNYTLQEWKKIEKEVESLGPLYNDAEHLSKLTLFYNQFPHHLKVCFLYFAIYPKGFKINVKRLIRIWIAEGFVGPLGHKELEGEAYCYLHELVQNGVVSISNWEHKMTNVCWMHSSLRDFCIREVKKEGLLCAVNTQQYLGLSLDLFVNSCRWLSLYSHRLDYYTLFSSNNPRSLFFFQGDSETLVSFKLLRIVDFSELQILKRVPLHLGDLVFLRYLSVPQWFEGLDDVVSNNQNLQTLVVSGTEPQLRTPIGHLASRIWELPHLRHLELGNFYTADPPSMVKEKLQTLSWVSPTHFTKEVYYSFPNINYLKVFYKDTFEPGRNPNIISLDYIEYLSKLETLTVIVPVGSITNLERPVFPAQLKKLRLSGTNLPVKVLEGIGQLRALKVLKLENAFKGTVWKPTTRFNSLKVLLIEARNLERWEASDYYFPKLKHLILRRCYCLEGIASEVEPFDTLETIELEQCPASVVTSAMRIQEKRKALHAMRFQKGQMSPAMNYNITRTLLMRDVGAHTPLTVVVDGVIHDFRSGSQ